MLPSEYPYEECATCKTLGDCKHVEVDNDMLGSPLPPDNCPRPIDVMRETVKLKKIRNIRAS